MLKGQWRHWGTPSPPLDSDYQEAAQGLSSDVTTTKSKTKARLSQFEFLSSSKSIWLQWIGSGESSLITSLTALNVFFMMKGIGDRDLQCLHLLLGWVLGGWGESNLILIIFTSSIRRMCPGIQVENMIFHALRQSLRTSTFESLRLTFNCVGILSALQRVPLAVTLRTCKKESRLLSAH